MAMRLNLDYSDFMPDMGEFKIEYLEKFLEDEFCQWDIDMAFDWNTLQLYPDHIEIEFSEFK